MKFEEKLKNQQFDEIWQEYCGFLDLSLDSYMTIQTRLMEEQISLWSNSLLGKQFLDEKIPKNIQEFRHMMPLTDYSHYADALLQKKEELLPDKPIIWIQTTWEGGKNPIKVAPYTRGMLDTYKNNVLACMILCTSTSKGKYNVRPNDKILYGLAPLPYATGLLPLALNEEISIEFLPPVKEAVNLSFSERNKKGFKLGFLKGIDYFFGLGSVAYFISLSLSAMSKNSKGIKLSSLFKYSPAMLYRLIKAKYKCKQEGRDLKPKDLFKLKGFMCAGTDNNCYKNDLEDLWGVRPLELFAGTEPTCIGTETWTRNGMYFFPDACFYEFIPEAEMIKNTENSSYIPKTCLMNEVIPDEKYELVISVLKGGAFMRYRVGDVYRCVGLESKEDKTKIPRFHYIDRVPSIIDIAGFTRISKASIERVIELSGLPITDWFAAKEYKSNRPYLHLYVELNHETLISQAVSKEILKEHLTIYFKYVDNDYKDLKTILGIDPLEITILQSGTFKKYKQKYDKKIPYINPSIYEIREILKTQEENELFVRRSS